MLRQNYLDNSIPLTRLVLYDEALKPIKELASFDDPAFRIFYKGKSVSKLQIMAFAPKLTVFGDPGSREFLVGRGDQSFFTIFDESGEMLTKVHFKTPRPRVTEEDQDEFARQAYLRVIDYYDWTSADYHPYYDSVLPLGKQFFIYRISPFYKKVSGYLLNRSGKVLGRVALKLGENGNLFGAGGRIFAVKTDENGEFFIQELKVKAPGS